MPRELKCSMNGLINIKNNDNKFFLVPFKTFKSIKCLIWHHFIQDLFYSPDQKFENCLYLLLNSDEKSCIMSTSMTATDLCAIKQNVKIKKNFCRYYLQCFSKKNVLTEQKEVCLKINGKKKLKLISS